MYINRRYDDNLLTAIFLLSIAGKQLYTAAAAAGCWFGLGHAVTASLGLLLAGRQAGMNNAAADKWKV